VNSSIILFISLFSVKGKIIFWSIIINNINKIEILAINIKIIFVDIENISFEARDVT
jgi:hypothetical protein